MIVHRNLMNYVVDSLENIGSALEKIEKNKHKLVYVVDTKNHLLGSFADGDFRRWCLKSKNISMSQSILSAFNPDCFYLPFHTNKAELQHELNLRNSSIPLVDDKKHLVAIVEQGSRFLNIGEHRISAEDPAFVIAEIGNNHQGDIHLAKELVDVASEAGVLSAKFQMRDMVSLYGDKRSGSEQLDLGAQYTVDLLNKYQLSNDELLQVFDYTKSKGLLPLCTPWDENSLAVLEEWGMSAYKVASADFTNFPLLEKLAKTGKPLLCSTGMASDDEILKTVSWLEKNKAQFTLLHCNSTYPTPYKDVHLNYLKNLEKYSGGFVGYSGHERGIFVPVVAVALGAKVIEKHITLDRNMEGNDHKVSLLPSELKQMMQEIRSIEQAMGSSKERQVTQGEMINRQILAKSVVAAVNIKKGVKLQAEHLQVLSPGNGLQPNRIDELLGQQAKRDLRAGELFFESDLSSGCSIKSIYDFSRPYGIPVRYHDYKKLLHKTQLDFVEFHLSYQDLELDPSNFVSTETEHGVVVHAPELFENDHLLDLTSEDIEYRNKSIEHLRRVIGHTRKLKTHFIDQTDTVLVVNVGGWSRTGFLSADERARRYDNLMSSLQQLDLNGIQLAVQTMPPFPWHFGGQNYHNLFVHYDDIVNFCEHTKHRICLDVSHTFMAMKHLQLDFTFCLTKIAPYVVHLHISDAEGVDGEGVKIGEGDVDFYALGRVLNDVYQNIPFIPEIWQGHINEGEGFWEALGFLEKKLDELCLKY